MLEHGSQTSLRTYFCCDGSEKEHTLVIDSGVSSHTFFDRSLLFDFSEETQCQVENENRVFRKLRVLGKFLFILLDKEGIERCVTFSNFLFLPDLSDILISVSKLRQNGAQVNFGIFTF